MSARGARRRPRRVGRAFAVGVSLVVGIGWLVAQAAASPAASSDDGTLVGQLVLPEDGTAEGFPTDAGQERNTEPRWSLEESARAPWTRLRPDESQTLRPAGGR